MTTAFLSVGIKTDSARAALKELRAELANGVKVAVAIDPQSIDQSIQGYLRQRTFKIKVETRALAAEIENDVGLALDRTFTKQRTLVWNQAAFRGGMNAAMEAAFGARRRLSVDTDQLANNLIGTVQLALGKPYRVGVDVAALAADLRAAGAAVSVGATGVAAPAGGMDEARMLSTIGNRVQAALVGPLDKLGKSAEMVAAVAAQVTRLGRAVDSSGQSGKRARTSVSVTDPITGERTAVSNDIGSDKLASTESTVRQGAAEAARLRMLQDSSNETFRVRRRLAAQEARAQAEERKAEEAGETDRQKLLQQSANETYRVRRRLWAREQAEAAAAQKEVQRARDAAEADTRKLMEQSATETFRIRRRLAAQAEAERKAADQAEKAEEEAKQKLLQQSAAETFRIRRRLAAQEIAQRRAEMKALADAAEFESGDQYNAKGRRVLRASAVAGSGRFSDQEVRSFVGNDAVLAAVGNLDRYRKEATKAGDDGAKALEKTSKAVKVAAADTEALRRVSNDAHSAARGLAGSLGAIWLTWGSTLPIAGAAGIGATLRSAVVQGKELEYQLAFVKALSDGATVSMTDLGDAAVGAMTRPTDAAQGLRGLAQNGLDAAQSLKALPAVLDLATAGEMALGEAALGATGVMAAFNLHVDDLGRVGDVFAKAASMSNTSVISMVESMKQASTVSDQYGVTLEETAATLAVMAKRNIEGSAAGTAFRNMMTELATPTEQAKKALQMLGVEAFDSTGKLKPYTVVLREIKEAIVLLDEKSKLDLLNKIFGERGGKAANAVLTDLELFNRTLGELQNNAQGFASSVTQQLGETTAGQFKKLMAEFELTTTKAFGGAKNSIDEVITRLREMVNSPEFTAGVTNLVNNVALLTSAFIDNKDTLIFVAEAYVAYRIATALAETALVRKTAAAIQATLAERALGVSQAATTVATTQAAAAQTAAATATAAAAGATALLTVGITAVVGVLLVAATTAMAFADNTNEAEQAQKALANQLDGSIDSLQKHIDKLAQENEELSVRNQLMREGLGYEAASKKARDQVGDKNGAGQVATLQAQKAALEAAVIAESASIYENMGPDGVPYTGRLEALNKQLDAVNANIERQAKEQSLKAQARNEETKAAEQKTFGDRLNMAREFNRRLDEISNKSGGRIRTADLRLGESDSDLSSGDWKSTYDEAQKQLNARLESRSVATRAQEAEQDRLAQARLARLSQEARQSEEMLKLQARNYRDLQMARFDPSRFGQEMSALIAEQVEREYTAKLVKIEEDAIRSLEAQKAGRKGSEIERINAEIDARKHNVDVMRAELEARSAIERAKVHNEEIKRQEAFDKAVNDANLKADGLARKESLGLYKVSNTPEDVARESAEAQVRAAYEQVIASARERVLSIETQIDELTVSALLSTEEEVDLSNDQVAAAQARLDKENEVLGTLLRQVDARAGQAGDAAAGNQRWKDSAAGGWAKFWNDYRREANTAGKDVYDMMRTTTSGMAQMVGDFAITGKLKWREFAAGVAAEAARMMANKAVLALLNFAMEYWGGGSGSGVTSGNVGVAQQGAGAAGYANGGVSDGPQLAWVSEGRYRREAHVPLPDGRTIPVTINDSGKQSGQSSGAGSVSVTVIIQSDGSSKTTTQGEEADARAFAGRLKATVLQVIADEKRIGGQLEKAA